MQTFTLFVVLYTIVGVCQGSDEPRGMCHTVYLLFIIPVKSLQIGTFNNTFDVVSNGVVQFFYLPLIHSVMIYANTTTW